MRTSAAIDSGMIRLDDGLKRYPLAPQAGPLRRPWRDMPQGARGAPVIVGTRRIDEGYPAMDRFEQVDIAFLVAVNLFRDRLNLPLDEVRALATVVDKPVKTFDARWRPLRAGCVAHRLPARATTRDGGV
jgi:uncharacterized protein